LEAPVNDDSNRDPDLDTVERCVTIREVMAIYRIGRCTAYQQASLYLQEGPGHGIPCLRIGAAIRFPVAWIEAHIGRPLNLDRADSSDLCT
jgi:hypothetical protein